MDNTPWPNEDQHFNSPCGSRCGQPMEFAAYGERVDSRWTNGLRPCDASPTA